MRYIKGRSNLSCTIFVPWDCKNHCKFCTSKQMYKERTCDIDAIIAQIKKINENPLIQEFVLTGGETVAIVGQEYSSVSSDEKFYRKEDVDKLLIEKDKEIKQLEYLLHITSKAR